MRFVNLTASGLLAGSLGFGEQALVPGWRHELPSHRDRLQHPIEALKNVDYFNAIGPLALGTAVTLAVAARDTRPIKRVLDAASALGLAGVLAATIMVTVPINKQLEQQAPADYPSDRSHLLARNWSRAHAMRTTLGISAFVFAVASSVAPKK